MSSQPLNELLRYEPSDFDPEPSWSDGEPSATEILEDSEVGPICATCDGKGFYWFLSLGRRVRVRCLACQPAPVDPWRFHS